MKDKQLIFEMETLIIEEKRDKQEGKRGRDFGDAPIAILKYLVKI